MKTLFILFSFVPLVSFAQTASPQGTYVRSCYVEDTDALSTHLEIQNDFWTLTHIAYEDENCHTAYLIYQIKYKTQIQGNNLDMTALEASYVSLSDTVSEALNYINYCGYSDWQTNTPKVVTGHVCDEYYPPREGEILYSIFDMSSVGDQSRLLLGLPNDRNNGKTPSTRYNELDARYFEHP